MRARPEIMIATEFRSQLGLRWLNCISEDRTWPMPANSQSFKLNSQFSNFSGNPNCLTTTRTPVLRRDVISAKHVSWWQWNTAVLECWSRESGEDFIGSKVDLDPRKSRQQATNSNIRCRIHFFSYPQIEIWHRRKNRKSLGTGSGVETR